VTAISAPSRRPSSWRREDPRRDHRIAGSHIKSFNSHGMVAIKDKEVSQYDIDRVIETARAVNIPMEQQVLHIWAGIHHRWPGRRAPAARHERHAPRGEGAHRDRGRVRRAEHHEVRSPLRPRGRDLMLSRSPRPTRSARRRARPRRVPGGRRRRHHRPRRLHRGRHQAHERDPDRRRPITNDIAMALRTPTKDAEELKIRHGVALRQLAA